jgi:ankyrin repeat protein
MRKHESFICKLINYEQTDKRKPQKQGFTPLHAAIHKDLDDIATILIQDSDVNAKDKYGKTALHVACEKAKIGLIQMLLNNGADPRIITKRGDTVYHILRRSKKKLPGNDITSQRAEQLMREFDPEFAERLPTLKNKAGIVIRPLKRVHLAIQLQNLLDRFQRVEPPVPNEHEFDNILEDDDYMPDVLDYNDDDDDDDDYDFDFY